MPGGIRCGFPRTVCHFVCAFRGRPKRTGLTFRLAVHIHAAPPQGTCAAPPSSGLPLAAWSALRPSEVPSPKSPAILAARRPGQRPGNLWLRRGTQ